MVTIWWDWYGDSDSGNKVGTMMVKMGTKLWAWEEMRRKQFIMSFMY